MHKITLIHVNSIRDSPTNVPRTSVKRTMAFPRCAHILGMQKLPSLQFTRAISPLLGYRDVYPAVYKTQCWHLGHLRDKEVCEDLNCVIVAYRFLGFREQVDRLRVISGFLSPAYLLQEEGENCPFKSLTSLVKFVCFGTHGRSSGIYSVRSIFSDLSSFDILLSCPRLIVILRFTLLVLRSWELAPHVTHKFNFMKAEQYDHGYLLKSPHIAAREEQVRLCAMPIFVGTASHLRNWLTRNKLSPRRSRPVLPSWWQKNKSDSLKK